MEEMYVASCMRTCAEKTTFKAKTNDKTIVKEGEELHSEECILHHASCIMHHVSKKYFHPPPPSTFKKLMQTN